MILTLLYTTLEIRSVARNLSLRDHFFLESVNETHETSNSNGSLPHLLVQVDYLLLLSEMIPLVHKVHLIHSLAHHTLDDMDVSRC